MLKNQDEAADVLHVQIKITGLVQGVGFRPFVYREAMELGMCGEVENRSDGVFIQLQTTEALLALFLDHIRHKAPAAAIVENIIIEQAKPRYFKEFAIVSSQNLSEGITGVSPDIGVCDDCLQDMKLQPQRTNYPFINCTHCGPRFTIIRDLPYDRPQTTMGKFVMCKSCSEEYHQPDNRRFHAQPTACNNCGPSYTLYDEGQITGNLGAILKTISSLMANGEVVTIKGLGGFHLMCDAFNDAAVATLRHLKHRENKPFAVMCRDLKTAQQLFHLKKEEENSLTSWQRPIVLLSSKKALAPSISNGLHRTGVMLPYLPFHHLIFEELRTSCIVLTSGNLSDEPIVIHNEIALNLFRKVTKAVIINDRDIHNRCDDSVVMVVNKKEILLRRSRGYVPAPIKVHLNTSGIAGAGAELTNCFAIGEASQIILSQHIGDLKNAETFEFYKETYARFSRLFRFKPQLIACDLHPNYLSSVFADELSAKLDIPLVQVQHHHAHVAACMAEHCLDEEVIGISMDGVGLGTDGHIWGGEFFVADLATFERKLHFEYIPISGGDELPYEPWKSALAYLHHYFGDEVQGMDIPLLKMIPPANSRTYLLLLKKQINTWHYSSAGRLFDAVAALTGVCTKAGFHAEAPMRLESVADSSINESYPYEITTSIISFKPMFEAILQDIRAHVSIPVISAKFHTTLSQVITEGAIRIHQTTGLQKVVLSGGTFQNALLLEKLYLEFSKTKLQLFIPQQIPSNDGGIALGQVIIASKLKEKNKV
jgi:hydrogenase maturation protein HypF